VIATLLFLASTQAAIRPPVIPPPPPITPIASVSWACEASGAQLPKLMMSGAFPAVSAEAQKDNSAFHLQSAVKASDQSFTGSFSAAMTGTIAGMNRYSIYVEDPPHGLKNLIMFDFFPESATGFVNVIAFDRNHVSTAFAAGTCKLRVAQ
jgi:hypothetical protein